MSQGQYVAAVYGVVFVVVLAYVAIIAAKLVRIQRQVAELLAEAPRGQAASDGRARRVDSHDLTGRSGVYAARVFDPGTYSMTHRRLAGRPLPVQAPTAFVRIRTRGGRLCGEGRARSSPRVRPGRGISPPLTSALPRRDELDVRLRACSSRS